MSKELTIYFFNKRRSNRLVDLYLNLNPDLVKKYNELKIKSAGLTHDEYREIKSDFIQKTLAGQK